MFNRAPIEVSEILIAGTARNVERFIKSDIDSLRSSFSDFKKVHFLIVESDSSDGTLTKLTQLKSENIAFDFITLGNLSNTHPKRTERIAFCRNKVIDALLSNQQYNNIDYVAVADLDSVNAKLTREGVRSCWDIELDWGGVTANQTDEYYDIWALRHDYWNADDCWVQRKELERFTSTLFAENLSILSKKIHISPATSPIKVHSAFGGLAIYKRDAFVSSRYIGLREDVSEICEHVPFHRRMEENGYQLFINPKMLNCTAVVSSLISTICIQCIRKVGVGIFGRNRFNKYLSLLKDIH
jgi:hypothetical protein